MSKYRNQPAVVEGVRFDSQREALHYLCLLDRVKYGEITDLVLQPRYELQPAYRVGARRVAAIEYVADFAYTENGRRVVEDVKGYETDVFKLKRKLFEFRYTDLDFRIIT